MNDMNEEKNTDKKAKTGIDNAPWEKSFDKILTPFEEFIHRQATSGLLLMAMAVLALVLGKFIGITGASWLVLKPGVAVLSKDTRFTQIAGVSLLAGIGFTMSIFVAQSGFAHNADLLLMAKTGILFASLLAGISGFIWLYIVNQPVESKG